LSSAAASDNTFARREVGLAAMTEKGWVYVRVIILVSGCEALQSISRSQERMQIYCEGARGDSIRHR
jgi:hypothetical protein